jgi:hypothetical protein
MNDAVEGCQTEGVGRRFWGWALAIALLSIVTSCGRATRHNDLDAPPGLEPSPYSLWLSAARVDVNTPAELVAALVNHDGVDATFGVFATIDRWDGRVWRPYRELLMCLNGWNCDDPSAVGGALSIPDGGLTAKPGSVGSPQRFTTEGLSRGWYRITQHANEDIVAQAIFEVAVDAAPIAPLDPIDQPAISVTPIVVSPEGATVELGPLVPSTNGTSRDDVAQAVEGMEELVAVEQWDGVAWQSVGTITLHSSLVDELVRNADVPALTVGEYRFVRSGPNGSHSGRFWVADLGT